MTYITQLTGRKAMSIFQIMTMVLAGFVLVVLQSSTVQAQWTTNGTNINNTNTGNVGVGTSTPTSALEVQATDGPLTLSQPGITGKVTLQAAVGTDLHLSANAKYANSSWNRFDTTRPAWNIFAAPGADYAGIRRASVGAGAIVWTDFLRITNTGNVGIGTASPGAKLHVNAGGTSALLLGADTDAPTYNVVSLNGSVTDAGHLGLAGGGGTDKTLYVDTPTGGAINFRVNTSSKVIIDTSGNVGIGTTNPIYSFDVNGGINSFRAKAATVSSNDTIATFENASGIQAIVRANGNVGLGTTAPTAKLDVVGNLNASGTITGGTINAKYQDVAEWVQSSQQLAAGTVVVLDQTKSNQVIASTQAYDTRVAGVISSQPGITLGEKGESKVLVATTGRVKVKVDATSGQIKVGDLLVTSDKEGFAMKSEPISIGKRKMHAPGTLIGKALEPLGKGTGEILVLLSLQ
jgi:hypothetical protein